MRHHFQDHRYAFGVSTPLWDAIMGTMPQSKSFRRWDTGEPPASG